MSHEQGSTDELVQTDMPLAENAHASLLHSVTSQTPWWVVSVVFHGLVIALVGLVSIKFQLDGDDEPLMITTELLRHEYREEKKEEKKNEKEGALVPANFNPEKPESDIYVADEFRLKATEGLLETFDPDVIAKIRGARGNPEAKILFSSPNPLDKEGGSGGGGKSFIEDMPGAGLERNAGEGDGTFFGKGKGIGNGIGEGMGSWGRPDAAGQMRRFTEYNPRITGARRKEWFDAVKHALDWLKYHQEADGHWDVKKYEAANKNDVAITSLALLAFLGNGHTERVGEHKDTVQRAVKWLISRQKENGLIADDTDDAAGHRRGGYPMAIATLALAEAVGMANMPETRKAAQKAVDYCVQVHQYGEGSEKLGWRYAPKSEGDLSVSGWFIMALKSAKVSKLHVDVAAFDGAQRFLESVEVKEKGGESGYGPTSHFKYMANTEHAATAHRLTAIGTLARQFMGWKKEELQGSVEWFMNKGGVPEWGGNGEKVDLYYWYYGTMAVFQQGEPYFSKWSDAMLNAFLPNQRRNGDEFGSWDPVGDYSPEWGRVGQTALSALCLEVYYRYPRVTK